MRRYIQQPLVRLYLAALLVPLVCVVAQAQSTAFTFQGKLADGGAPTNANHDFEFKLFNTSAVGTGTQQGSTVQQLNVSVADGVFSVPLDFGACAICFNGAVRFLEISVKPTSGGAFTTLGPRQPITSTPYALKSVNATTSDGLSVTCVNCVTSSQIQSVAGSKVSGAIPVASVPAGNGNYIQNGASQQATSDFNISGSGTAGGTLSANFVNATTRFSIGNIPVLSNAGSQNLFAGGNSGTNGSLNAFFGAGAGSANTSSSANSFFGAFAGSANTVSFNNSFFGMDAGRSNTVGNNNTIIGQSADVGANNLTNATAIGFRAFVGQSNSLVLGSIDGVNSSTADTRVGIGTTAPAARFHVSANSSVFTTPVAIFQSVGSQVPLAFRSGGSEVARVRADSQGNLVLATLNGTDKDIYFRAGDDSGTDMFIQASSGNVGIGTTSPDAKLDVTGNIQVTGEVRRPATGTANMLPLCYGHVLVDGTIVSGSGNFSVATSQGSTLHVISVPGEDFGTGAHAYIVLVQVMNNDDPYIPTTSTLGGNLAVIIRDPSNGGARQADFSFVVYKP